jgi:malate synthase
MMHDRTPKDSLSNESGQNLVPEGIQLNAPTPEPYKRILTPKALAFLSKLELKFRNRIHELLQARTARQARIDAGELPDFLPETKDIREGDWKAAPLPEELLCRKVEITGPTERKMMINALNSGANGFMADLEDSNSPGWANMVEGQLNLYDAIRGTIMFTSPEGKEYRLTGNPAVLFVRPRGLHLPERHVLIEGRPMSGSLFDLGLFLFHNGRELVDRGTGPYIYIPKTESHVEARLWNDVLKFAEEELGLPKGVIKATVLLETVLAAFEMDEIIYELREHMAGLNFGRWDYIFSFIKKFRNFEDKVLPERSQVTMDKHFLKSCAGLLVHTCHKRGVMAIGGMAAQIPRKDDPEANALAMEKVRADKVREVSQGHDGTWVAHPGLVEPVKTIFEAEIPGKNQMHNLRKDALQIRASDLLQVPEGTVTEQGLRVNINVPLLYLESWLRGTGCVAIYSLMEDAATVEISRAQLWQWLRHGAKLLDGRRVNQELISGLIEDELKKIKVSIGPDDQSGRRFDEAEQVFRKLVFDQEFYAFMTTLAYEYLD